MLQRHDHRSLGNLCADDGARLSREQLLTDEILQAALNDATARILGVLYPGGRYTADQLANELSSESRYWLKRLCCNLAYVYLWQRRDMSASNEVKYKSLLEGVNEELEGLRSGKFVLEVQANIDAGHAKTDPVSAKTIQNTWGLVRDRMGSFPPRRESR